MSVPGCQCHFTKTRFQTESRAPLGVREPPHEAAGGWVPGEEGLRGALGSRTPVLRGPEDRLRGLDSRTPHPAGSAREMQDEMWEKLVAEKPPKSL